MCWVLTTAIVLGGTPSFGCYLHFLVSPSRRLTTEAVSRPFRKSNQNISVVPRRLIGAAQRCTLGSFTRSLSSPMSVFLSGMTSLPPRGERWGAERPNALTQLANFYSDHKLQMATHTLRNVFRFGSPSRHRTVTTSWRTVGHAGALCCRLL